MASSIAHEVMLWLDKNTLDERMIAHTMDVRQFIPRNMEQGANQMMGQKPHREIFLQHYGSGNLYILEHRYRKGKFIYS